MDRKITELPSASAVTSEDLFAVVDDPNGFPITKKATVAMVRKFIGGQIYEGRYPNAPDDPTLPALSYPIGGGSLSQWSVVLQQWV